MQKYFSGSIKNFQNTDFFRGGWQPETLILLDLMMYIYYAYFACFFHVVCHYLLTVGSWISYTL